MARSSRPPAVYGVDAGGTTTRVAIEVPGRPAVRRELGSVSPAVAGKAVLRHRLREVFTVIADAARGHELVGWIAGAGIVAPSAAAELFSITALLPPRSRVTAVSNDAVPMLVAPPLAGRGAVVVAGTGSGFLGGNGDTVVQVGGHEYLGADQGSAFDIGLCGLRAALRARDGTGPPSALADALSWRMGVDVAAQARRMAALPFPKQAVAGLAPVVLGCWLDGDEVAADVVGAAVDALAAGAARVRELSGLTATDGTVVTGGLVTGLPEFAAAVRAAVEHRCGRHPVVVLTDPVAAVLSCARRVAESGERAALADAYRGQHVWLVGASC
ncbi:BadF/BadG/BcrA/BcrD ATPase family protein [Actinophytocola sp.]|uniref:BadF/BadG/BcrA/BcrD ATPase family protein n=1 Tax=Actinophytocola sp. TaxID=1872138 RepID=UPI002ED27DE7